MRILILGNDYSCEKFFEYFSKDEKNIVFSTHRNCNFVEFTEISDIKEFCIANEINFILVIDEEYISMDISQWLDIEDIIIFSPSSEAVVISISKAAAKRFMYKNNIPTSKFQIFDKPLNALDYVKNLANPIAIKPDIHNSKECTKFCETSIQAQKVINDLFKSGNEKIIIEDYIQGKNIEIFILSDGYKFQILGISAKYQNNIAYFEPEFLNDETIENIISDVINPTITSLQEQGEEYIGILGFDIILKPDNSFYLAGYNSFFDDIDVDFYLKGFDIDWLKIFQSTVIGDVFIKYEINPKNDYMMTARQNNKINFIKAKTKSNLELYIKELYDGSEYKEAQKIWKS